MNENVIWNDGDDSKIVQSGTHIGDVVFNSGPGAEPRGVGENPVFAVAGYFPASKVTLAADRRSTVAVGGQVVVNLQSRPLDRAVILDRIRAVVLARRSPRPAFEEFRPGGSMPPRHFDVHLDDDPPRVEARGADFPFKISAEDPEQFRITVLLLENEVHWRLELDWTYLDRQGTTVIDDGGKPFETYPVGRARW
ncbi:hypothetical protein [Amycolatopsis alkalitolerans]|uniref:Uncharacterized protein n=1 Tax=Amycolatopsis alkalitolerans TaxID=2547244 RepID=A0A5C4M121_9PSEU|nr:hypothetical protein [Amycolatopsis alkalitolerans]TNC24933.1 hypothetical protein FG385_17010 [Amycolatopsis alkalitolerans]